MSDNPYPFRDFAWPLALFGLVAVALISGAWYLGKRSDERKMARPPIAEYDKDRVEVIGLSECLVQSVSADALGVLAESGAAWVEVARHDIEYKPCALLSSSTFDCGWHYRTRPQVIDRQGNVLAVFGGQSPALNESWESWFGVRVDLRSGQPKAQMPVSSIDPDRDMGEACRQYGDKILSDAANAIRWNKVAPAD